MSLTNPLRDLDLDWIRRRTSLKWNLYGPDVLPLWVAEMDGPIAEPVKAALHQAIDDSDLGYPMFMTAHDGAPNLYAQAYSEYAEREWGWQVDPTRIQLAGDVMNGITEVLRVSTAPGGTVVVSPPVYPPFFAFPGNAQRLVADAPLTPEGRLDEFALDAAFALASREGPASYLLCNPHNPVGTVPTRAELEMVAETAARHGVQVISDEIHAPLILGDQQFTPYASVDPRGISVYSASKAFNLAGLKGAVVVPGDDASHVLEAIPFEASEAASHLGVIAHAAALREGGEWLAGLRAGVAENAQLLAGLVAEHLPGVRYRIPDATYLAWLDCREAGLGDDPATEFLERAQVALMNGPAFGAGGAGHCRLNLATSPEVITEAVRRMASILPGGSR